VDDEDEDVDEDDEDLPDETHPDDLVEDRGPGVINDDRAHRELDRARELQANIDAEKQAEILKERYGRNRAAQVDAVVVPQQLLLPTVDDPTIWALKCKPGKEREIVMAIMKRAEDRAATREPLQITSAFERGASAMQGFIYVEARRQADVMEAVDGIAFAYPRMQGGAVGTKLIPVGEMPDLLKVRKSKEINPSDWVRIRKPQIYAGDLAQIDAVESNGTDVAVKLVPRLDYGTHEDMNAAMGADGKRKRPGFALANAPRPPQKLFNETEARKKDPRSLVQVSSLGRKHFTFKGKTYIDGFLILDLKINQLTTEDVKPSLHEATMFNNVDQDGTENLDLQALAQTLKATESDYVPGDMVEIYQGEQKGISGRAVKVHGDIVSIAVTEGEMKGQEVEAPKKGLRKKFAEGDHVKIIGGSKYQDEVGLVVRVKDDRVTLISDSNNETITVFSKDLREAADSGLAPGSSKYELYDLVELDAANVACVIKVDRESLRVLDQNGTPKTILPSSISNKIEKRKFAVATDRDGSEIRHDDTVKEQGGEGKVGHVLHIHRSFLFILNRQLTENSGVFVARTSNVTTVAAKGGKVSSAGPDLSKMNPALQRGGAANGAPMPMAPPKSIGRDRLIGRTVVIKKGGHKGLLGIVKDANDTEARVELHTKNKIVAVDKLSLNVKDTVTGQSIDYAKFAASGGRGGPPGRAPGGPPRYGNSTPSRQPAWEGSRTPMAASGGKTPAWGMQSGSRTPGWSSGAASGARTPGWGGGGGGMSGGRTPGWSANDGSRTVNPYADGNRTAYGGAGNVSTVRLILG